MRSLLVLLFCHIFTINGHHHDDLRLDGPCRNPPKAQENVDLKEFAGHWLLARTNCELFLDPLTGRQCIESKAEVKENELLTITHYKNQTLDDIQVEGKFVPIEDQPGRYRNYKKNQNGVYELSKYEYTIVRIEDGNLLSYGCGNTDEHHHREFYQIYAKSLPIPEKIDESFSKIVKENGDDRELRRINHENCNYKLN